MMNKIMRWTIIVCMLIGMLPATIQAAIPLAEREALLALYESTDGPNWINNDGWGDAPGTECTWSGVFCHTGGNHVTSLYLGGNQLSGPIPDLSALTQLEYLRLESNKLSGPIPDASALPPQVRTLGLEGNVWKHDGFHHGHYFEVVEDGTTEIEFIRLAGEEYGKAVADYKARCERL